MGKKKLRDVYCVGTPTEAEIRSDRVMRRFPHREAEWNRSLFERREAADLFRRPLDQNPDDKPKD